MKHIHDLKELFIEQLKEQYDGERQQLEAFPKLRERTSTKTLLQSIDYHIGKTKKQMQRLERIFSSLDRNLHGEENKGVKGLIEEALELAERCVNEGVRDAGIITAIQHLNHHNIASYGTLCIYAKELGMDEIKKWLGESLTEEKLTDQDLSTLAETSINLKAIL